MLRDRLNVAFLALSALATLSYLVTDAAFFRYPGLLMLGGYLLTVSRLSALARLLLLVNLPWCLNGPYKQNAPFSGRPAPMP